MCHQLLWTSVIFQKGKNTVQCVTFVARNLNDLSVWCSKPHESWHDGLEFESSSTQKTFPLISCHLFSEWFLPVINLREACRGPPAGKGSSQKSRVFVGGGRDHRQLPAEPSSASQVISILHISLKRIYQLMPASGVSNSASEWSKLIVSNPWQCWNQLTLLGRTCSAL